MRSPGPACSRWTRRRLPAPWRSAIPRAPPPGRLGAGSEGSPIEPSGAPCSGRGGPDPCSGHHRCGGSRRPAGASVAPPRPRRISPSPAIRAQAVPARRDDESTPSTTAPHRARFPANRQGSGSPPARWARLALSTTPCGSSMAGCLLWAAPTVIENETSAELYDPVSGTWSATGNMLRPDGGFPATLLRDGRVLVGDGDDPNADEKPAGPGAEVYDPDSGTWTATGQDGHGLRTRRRHGDGASRRQGPCGARDVARRRTCRAAAPSCTTPTTGLGPPRGR